MNNEKLYALAGGINDDFVAETMKHKAARPRYLRYIAAAAAVLLIAGGAFGIVKAAGMETNTPIPEDAVLPPTRSGTDGYIHSKIRGPFTIGSAKEASVAVCVLTIGDWIGEDDDETFFDAKVEKVICGELPEHIALCQHGNSKWTSKGFPLLTYGDRLLAFLRDVTWNDEQPDNCYTFTGLMFTHFFIEKANDGREYAIDRAGNFSYYTKEREPGFDLENHSDDDALVQSLINRLQGYDELLADWLKEYFRLRAMDIPEDEITEIPVRIFSLEELERYIVEIG